MKKHGSSYIIIILNRRDSCYYDLYSREFDTKNILCTC